MIQPGMSQPKVVALMPAYNAQTFILPVLESWAVQTYPNLDVMISDDSSKDSTVKICKDFCARHSNFRLICQRQNLGYVGNVNSLLNMADGDYYVLAFHDDKPKPTYVERLVEALECNPRAVLSFSDMIRRTSAAEPKPEDIKVYTYLEDVTDRVERGVRVARWQGEPPSYLVTLANRGMFRANAAHQVGGIREHFAGDFAVDWPWLLHLALLGEFVRVPEALIEKFYPPTSITANWKYSNWQRLGVFYACMREVRRANLPLNEELKIQSALIFYALQRQWWQFNRKVFNRT